ncbi:universal stress protein [Glutamicibacter sp.]|uniref:universal stress protein n=1 Tax=Glutamicibacter sp. TaxID=1931995 RepID=UPI0028BE4B7B|nr:universal stress protein [Glutamicibacter sp.]
MGNPSAPIIVGVYPGQDQRVLEQAARLAEQMGAALICVWVDPTRYTVDRLADGTVVSSPIDPDSTGHSAQVMPPELFGRFETLLNSYNISWEVRARAGNASFELGLLADDLDARLIVLGSRERSLRTSLHELLNGSVAVRLAQKQLRPILIVPSTRTSNT